MDQVQEGNRRVVRFRPESKAVGQVKNKRKVETDSRDKPGMCRWSSEVVRSRPGQQQMVKHKNGSLGTKKMLKTKQQEPGLADLFK